MRYFIVVTHSEERSFNGAMTRRAVKAGAPRALHAGHQALPRQPYLHARGPPG